MIRALYDGASALHVLERQHQATANNLANINSAGYRGAQFSVIQQRGEGDQANNVANGPQIEQLNVDFSQGRLVQTGRPLDVALFGDAFIEFTNENGEAVYSKNGRLLRSTGSANLPDGTLVTDTGLTLNGINGPIIVPQDIGDQEISIAADGTITAGNNQLGQIRFTAFENNQTLTPLSQSVFQAGPGAIEAEPAAELRQGYFESANVNPASELVGLVVGGRLYEAIQKATRTISEALEQSIRS